jgi:hypothetical protein
LHEQLCTLHCASSLADRTPQQPSEPRVGLT